MTEPAADPIWDDAMLAAAVFAVDPAGIGGISLRSRIGPALDRWLALLRSLLPPDTPVRRIPPDLPDARLLGGLDLSATLASDRPVAERGILAEIDGGVALLVMAERLSASVTARLTGVLDTGQVFVERDGIGLRLPTRFGVVALDEGIADDECPPAALLDRLAMLVDLNAVGRPSAYKPPYDRDSVQRARARRSGILASDDMLEAICATAGGLGITALRPSLLTVRVARAIAALNGAATIRTEDAAAAARLVLAPRARILPTPPPQEAPAETPDPGDAGAQTDSDGGDAGDGAVDRPVGDLVLAAAQASIPAGLLARMRLGGLDRARSTASGKAGAVRRSTLRGRPIGVRKADPRSGARLNLIETLRAAAPWQKLRRRPEHPRRIEVRRDDFRVTRLKQRSETIAIFAVDASGSSALNRLAEAKGAIELLLAECYVRRDRVALIAFRGREAELLLAPTRSLVRAKRSLASLPGGGGTPLATGIDSAATLAESVRRQGRTPVIVLMTDGRANVARDGKGGRAGAEADAITAARALRSSGLAALLIDTSPHPQPSAGKLAQEMGASYLPLPSADAGRLSRAVQAASRA